MSLIDALEKRWYARTIRRRRRNIGNKKRAHPEG
jgi:hypothetical protein